MMLERADDLITRVRASKGVCESSSRRHHQARRNDSRSALTRLKGIRVGGCYQHGLGLERVGSHGEVLRRTRGRIWIDESVCDVVRKRVTGQSMSRTPDGALQSGVNVREQYAVRSTCGRYQSRVQSEAWPSSHVRGLIIGHWLEGSYNSGVGPEH